MRKLSEGYKDYFNKQTGLNVRESNNADSIANNGNDVVVVPREQYEREIRNEETQFSRTQTGVTSGHAGQSVFMTYPDVGSRFPSNVGGFSANLINNTISKAGYTPNVTKLLTEVSGNPKDFVRSAVIILDDHANVRLNQTKFLLDSCFVWAIPTRELNTIHVVPPATVVAQLVFTNVEQPTLPLPMSYSQERKLAETTLTKTNGAGLVDDFTALGENGATGWLASDGGSSGSNGKTFLHVMSYPIKNFMFHNTDLVNSIELKVTAWQIVGMFEVDEPSTSPFITLAPDEKANIQITNYYHFLKVWGRLPQATASGQTATIEGQFRANTTS